MKVSGIQAAEKIWVLMQWEKSHSLENSWIGTGALLHRWKGSQLATGRIGTGRVRRMLLARPHTRNQSCGDGGSVTGCADLADCASASGTMKRTRRAVLGMLESPEWPRDRGLTVTLSSALEAAEE
jgi:hypothetical protein